MYRYDFHDLKNFNNNVYKKNMFVDIEYGNGVQFKTNDFQSFLGLGLLSLLEKNNRDH